MEKAPQSEFVRETYNSLLKQLPTTYTSFRWEKTPISRFHYRQSRRALQRALRFAPHSVERTLEIGGGDGAWTPFFARRAHQIDFLDISEEMLTGARTALKNFPQVHFIHADFLSYQPDKGAYDLVVSLRNLEYMRDKSGAISRMAEALRPGGHLILSTKNPRFDWGGYFADKELHGGQITLTELENLLHKNGFSVLRIYPAILGKKTKYAFMRALWDVLQIISIHLPSLFTPRIFQEYLSESFLLVARRL